MQDNRPTPSALAGVRVLDLSRVLAGPWSTMILADLGAEVIKVESPGGGDDTRSWGVRVGERESTYYLCANRGKKDIALDLGKPEAQEIARSLARQSDIVIENFKLGGAARFGLDYERLSRDDPRLIYCSISGYGRNSPSAARPGYDLVAQAETGLMAINGEEGSQPLKFGLAAVDIVTGMYAAQAMLAALFARTHTGRGQHIDLALFDCGLTTLGYWANAALLTGQNPKRYGNAHPDVVPYGLFQAADGALIVAIGNDGQFRRFCEGVIERPDLARDERFRGNGNRMRNREALMAELEPALSRQTRAELARRMDAHDVPGGAVRELTEALRSPDAVARGLVQSVRHPLAGPVELLASPLKLSGTPVKPLGMPPTLGQHTDEVLRDLAGLSAARIAELRAAGAVA